MRPGQENHQFVTAAIHFENAPEVRTARLQTGRNTHGSRPGTLKSTVS